MENEIVTVPDGRPFFKSTFGIAFVAQMDTGEWDFSPRPDSCRTYLNEILYMDTHPSFQRYTNKRVPKGWKLNRKQTQIFIYPPTDRTFDKKEIEENLKKLNELEEKYGIKKTVMVKVVKHTPGYVFIGDTSWQKNLWKLTIYTFLLKFVVVNYKSFSERDMEVVLEKLKERFLSKIKTYKGVDKLYKNTPVWEKIHIYSGFYSIASMKEHPMRFLIDDDKEIDKPSIREKK